MRELKCVVVVVAGRGSDTKQYHNTFLGSDSFSYLTGICLKGGGGGGDSRSTTFLCLYI